MTVALTWEPVILDLKCICQLQLYTCLSLSLCLSEMNHVFDKELWWQLLKALLEGEERLWVLPCNTYKALIAKVKVSLHGFLFFFNTVTNEILIQSLHYCYTQKFLKCMWKRCVQTKVACATIHSAATGKSIHHKVHAAHTGPWGALG